MIMAEPTIAQSDAKYIDLPEFARQLMAGQPFRGYGLEECLEANENAALFRSRDLVMDRPTTVRAIKASATRPDAVDKFFSEARGVARVRHPRVIRGLDVGRADDRFFFVYEFVRGESLANRLKRRERGRLTEKESLVLVREAAEALQGVFEQGLTHGMVCPENLLFAENAGIALTNLGFAWQVAYPDDRAAILANPHRMSPETADEDPNADIRGDLYSLGCVWFESLLGRPVFPAASPEEILRRHREETVESPRDLDPRLSAATSRLIGWLLEKDRDDRPRTPNDFLNRLREHPLSDPAPAKKEDPEE